MICEQCGTGIPAGIGFCPECGSAVKAPEPEATFKFACPHCRIGDSCSRAGTGVAGGFRSGTCVASGAGRAAGIAGGSGR